MATATGLAKAGFEVHLYEHYAQARPAGNVRNLWPLAVFALEEMGTDIRDLGVPCHDTNIRVILNIPPTDAQADSSAYHDLICILECSRHCQSDVCTCMKLFSPALQDLITNIELKGLSEVVQSQHRSDGWSNGRIALVSDAAHATSPYAAYGAGMFIFDGYHSGQCLLEVDLSNLSMLRDALRDFETIGIPHTTAQLNNTYC